MGKGSDPALDPNWGKLKDPDPDTIVLDSQLLSVLLYVQYILDIWNDYQIGYRDSEGSVLCTVYCVLCTVYCVLCTVYQLKFHAMGCSEDALFGELYALHALCFHADLQKSVQWVEE